MNSSPRVNRRQSVDLSKPVFEYLSFFLLIPWQQFWYDCYRHICLVKIILKKNFLSPLKTLTCLPETSLRLIFTGLVVNIKINFPSMDNLQLILTFLKSLEIETLLNVLNPT